MNQKTKKLIILNIPYVVIGLFCTNIGEAWRMAAGTDISTKLLGFFTSMGAAWGTPCPACTPSTCASGLPSARRSGWWCMCGARTPRNTAMGRSMGPLDGVHNFKCK